MVNVLQKIDLMLYEIILCNRFEFDRQTSRCVTFDSSEGTARLSMIPLSHFEDDPHYARVTPPFAPMITYVRSYVVNVTDEIRRFESSLLGDNYALVDTLYMIRRSDKTICLRHCRAASDG